MESLIPELREDLFKSIEGVIKAMMKEINITLKNRLWTFGGERYWKGVQQFKIADNIVKDLPDVTSNIIDEVKVLINILGVNNNAENWFTDRLYEAFIHPLNSIIQRVKEQHATEISKILYDSLNGALKNLDDVIKEAGNAGFFDKGVDFGKLLKIINARRNWEAGGEYIDPFPRIVEHMEDEESWE